jgi:hypothetical protein
LFFDGTLKPMVITMLIASVAANACAFLTRPAAGAAEPAAAGSDA